MKRLDAPLDAVHLHARTQPIQESVHAVTGFVRAQQGLLIDLGAGLTCAMFSMAVIAGVYYLLDRR
jgi:hypothetical protein